MKKTLCILLLFIAALRGYTQVTDTTYTYDIVFIMALKDVPSYEHVQRSILNGDSVYIEKYVQASTPLRAIAKIKLFYDAWLGNYPYQKAKSFRNITIK